MFNQVKNMLHIVIDDTVHNRDMYSYFTRGAHNVQTTFREPLK